MATMMAATTSVPFAKPPKITSANFDGFGVLQGIFLGPLSGVTGQIFNNFRNHGARKRLNRISLRPVRLMKHQ